MVFERATTAEAIAKEYGCEIIGDAQMPIYGLNEIHNVQKGDITFVDHEKYYASTLASVASVILINKKIEAPKGKTLLFAKSPFDIYNAIAKIKQPEIHQQTSIGKSAKIGKNSFVFPTAFVGENVIIGKNCVIHPSAVIYPYTIIGDNVVIHANSTIGADAFYYKRDANGYLKMHTAGKVVIENNVEIGAGCTIDAGVSSETRIGEGTKIDDQVHIGHDVKVGKGCVFAGQVGVAGNTKIGNNVTLYGRVAVNKNIEIGDNVVVMATSAVAKSLEAGKTYFGTPADEMRTFARQIALIRKLPEIWEKVRKL